MLLALMDAIRESRRQPNLDRDLDKALLNRLDDIFITLSDTEQLRVESENWRAWPLLYDQHMRALAATLPEAVVRWREAADDSDDLPLDVQPRRDAA